MTSALAQQLRKVSLALGSATESRAESHASLLYNAQEAAETDTQTIYENAVYGLEQLARVDVRFFAYQKSLFGASTLSMSRGRLTKEELAAVDKSISAFLRLLSPHFLHPACFKTLEYLLRKYRVHIHNVEQLLGFFLPFHATKQYVRLIQACQLDPSPFLFLQPMQQSGASLPRASIVRRCQTDKAWLRLICDFGRRGGSLEFPNKFLVTLYAVTVCELLMAEARVEEDTVRLLLPYLLHGVGGGGIEEGGASPDYRAATLMVLTQLCTVATLAPDFLEVLLQQIFKHAGPGEERQTLMTAIHLIDTHPRCTSLPKSVIKAVLKMPQAAAILEEFRSKGARTRRFLHLLLSAVCSKMGTSLRLAFLLNVVQTVALGELARLVADAVLERQADESSDDTAHRRKELLRALDLRYPEEVDVAINSALQKSRASGDGQASQLADFVAEALTGSARVPLAGASTTVAHAVDAPSAQLRIEALKRLEEVAENESEQDFVRAALLRRLADEEPAVVEAALASPSLALLPAGELAQGISRLLLGARQTLEGHAGDKASRKALREVVKKAMRVLAEHAQPETEDQIAAELLNFVLAVPSSRKIAALAAKLAASLHPAFSGLHGGSQSMEEGGEDSKAEATSWNRAAIEGLAASLSSAQPAFIARVMQLAGAPGRHLLLLALSHGCSKGCQVAAAAVLEAAEQAWQGIESPAPGRIDDISEETFDGRGLPTAQYLEAAVAHPERVLAALLQHALQAALQGGMKLDDQKARVLFAALSRKPWQGFRPHLEAIVLGMGGKAPAFLADIFAAPGVPAEEQVCSLRLLPVAIKGGSSEKHLADLVPKLLVALNSPAEAVRAAALEILPGLIAGFSSKQEKPFAGLLEGLSSQAPKILADPAAVPELLSQLLAESSSRRRGAQESASTLLLDSLETLKGPAGLHAAGLLLQALQGLPSRLSVLKAAAPLVSRCIKKQAEVSEQARNLALQFIGLLTPEAAAEAAAEPGGIEPFQLLASLIAAPGPSAMLPVELAAAAAKAVTPPLFGALPPALVPQCLMALLVASAHSASNEVRLAAHKALEELPLSAALLQPCLMTQHGRPTSSRSPASKRSRRSAASPGSIQPPENLYGFEARQLMTATLETLAWKTDVTDGQKLLPSLSACLGHLLSQQQAAAAAPEGETDDSADAFWVTSKGYLTQLTLSALLHWASVEPPAAELEAVDLGAVVASTAASSSAQTRAVALELLAKLASLLPKQTLGQAVQIIAAVAAAAGLQPDAASQQAAAAALRAVVPAWLGAGAQPKALAATVLEALQGFAVHRALPLLAAVVAVLPEDGGLQVVLEVVLERSSEIAQATAAESEGTLNPVQGLRSEAALLELASLLSHQVPYSQQLSAFSGLLEAAVEASGGEPERPLPVLATALVAQELSQRRGGTHIDDSSATSLQRIIETGLKQLQMLGSKTASSEASRKVAAALSGAAALLEAVTGALPPAAYSEVVLRLLTTPQDSVKRRALRLFEAGLVRATQPGEIDAAMSFCGQYEKLMAEENPPATRQAALVALGSLAAAHGSSRPKPLLETLPAVIAQIMGSAWVVRSAAMAALCAIVEAAGVALLPALPRLVPAVLSAAAAATAELPDDDEAAMQHTASEAQQLEAQAALAVVRALIGSLGPYLSPHLSDLLALLLQPALTQQQGESATLAADARQKMCGGVPPRLLLPALAGHFEKAVQEGGAAVEQLLAMAGRTLEGLKPAAAATHADLLWALTLKGMDLRLTRPAGVPHVERTEAAAVQLLTQLTLKLSESRFKPLFLRLLDWAAALPAEGERGPERQIALFKAVNGLVDNLRAVFVPYYRHLIDLAASHLAGGRNDPGGGKKKKKRRLSALSESPEAALLRYEVVKSLHKCFLYDRQGFVNEALFNRLLPHLVAQLATELPEELARVEVADAERPSEESAEIGLDAMANATVAALVQLAVTTSTDALWKPLHHQVLLATRSESLKERRRALEVVKQLIARLGEEYVVLVPEAMPFLSELLEDPELHIQNETREMIQALERLTGENLEEYLKV